MARGFVAHFVDGTNFSEGDGTWLQMPDKGIIELHYVLRGEVRAKVIGCDRYFFSNEAIHGPSLSGSPGRWVAAIIGGIKDGQVQFVRIAADGSVDKSWFPAKELGFVQDVYRKGALSPVQ